MSPVRVQLSRAKGFRLQAHSLALNGLSAVNVARPGVHGNLYTVEDCGAHEAVAAFRYYMTSPLWEDPYVRADQVRRRAALADLRGNNVACWCKLGAPCHGDVLLELANASDDLTARPARARS